ISLKTAPAVTAQSSAPGICAGESATLTAGGASSYVWTLPNSAGTSALNSIVVSPLVQTTYTLTGTEENISCSNTLHFVQQVDQCLGLKELVSKNNMAVYPNPGHGVFNLLFSSASDKIMEICDLAGRMILRETIAGSYSTLDLSAFDNGLYYLRLKTAE